MSNVIDNHIKQYINELTNELTDCETKLKLNAINAKNEYVIKRFGIIDKILKLSPFANDHRELLSDETFNMTNEIIGRANRIKAEHSTSTIEKTKIPSIRI